MLMKFSRRIAMQVLGAGAMSPLIGGSESRSEIVAQVPPPPKEGKDTPKIALGMGAAGVGPGTGRGGTAASRGNPPASDPLAGPRRIKQLGVDHVLGGGGAVPWTEQSL